MEGSLNTQGNFWFVIAVIEAAILILMLIQKLFLGKPKTGATPNSFGETITMILEATHGEDKINEENDAGRRGTITWLKFAKKSLGGSISSLIEITEADGNIFFAGIPGEETSLSEGTSIEFWPSPSVIGNIDKLKTADNADGTKSAWMENIKFFGLKKYRVIPLVTPTENDLKELEGPIAQAQLTDGEIPMTDTQFESFPGISCEDCKEAEASAKHWGPFVPVGTTPFLCGPCLRSRHKDFVDGKEPRPIGTIAEIAETVNAA